MSGDTRRPSRVEPSAIEPARWPELLYRLVEHYKWEPQHLGIGKGEGVAAFYDRIRRQEVPLNFLLNLVLAWSSSDTILAFLNEFDLDPLPLAGERFLLCHPYDAGFTQPDICLLSENVRIFVELKWAATIKVEQVLKYLFLHAALDERFGHRRPYLLFLTKEPFGVCWRPRRQAADGRPSSQFLQEIVGAAELPPKLAARLSPATVKRYSAARTEVTYGFATWREVCNGLSGLVGRLGQSSSHSEALMVRDFVSDLEWRLQRG